MEPGRFGKDPSEGGSFVSIRGKSEPAPRPLEQERLRTLLLAFDRFDETYEIEASQADGERVLGFIASRADREHIWLFDGTTSLWHYKPRPVSEKRTEAGDLVEHGVHLNEDERFLFLEPMSSDTCFYHTHPDNVVNQFAISREHRAIASVLPSDGDLRAAGTLQIGGFYGFRIVSSSGVTEVAIDLAVLESLSDPLELNDLANWSLQDAVAKLYSQNPAIGLHEAIQETIEQLQTALQRFGQHQLQAILERALGWDSPNCTLTKWRDGSVRSKYFERAPGDALSCVNYFSG